MRILILLMLFNQLVTSVLCQVVNLPSDILSYQKDISKAINYVNQQDYDKGIEYFLKANKSKPIHYWHTINLRFLLKLKFNADLFFILVKTEMEQTGVSTSLSDTAYLNHVSIRSLKKIRKEIPNWQIHYLRKIDRGKINSLIKTEVLDQFARQSDISYLLGCGDSCISFRRRMISFVDSSYSRKIINDIIADTLLSASSLGEAYTQFIVVSRHIIRKREHDSTFNRIGKEFYKNAVESYLIPPDYYANAMDYCFNFYTDSNGVYQPIDAFGEFSYFKHKLVVDNPENLDNRRASIGLLPLWETVADKSKLPPNYYKWYKSNYDNNKQ